MRSILVLTALTLTGCQTIPAAEAHRHIIIAAQDLGATGLDTETACAIIKRVKRPAHKLAIRSCEQFGL